MFPWLENGSSPTEAEPLIDPGPVIQTVSYSGSPRSIARYDIQALVRLAQQADAVVAIESGVGETLVEDAAVFHVHGGSRPLPERALMRTVHISTSRTFAQDPKYPIRLLVDIAIRRSRPTFFRLPRPMQDASNHACGRDAPETAQRKREKQQRHTEYGKELGPDHIDARATQ
jgi:hypothetical protein